MLSTEIPDSTMRRRNHRRPVPFVLILVILCASHLGCATCRPRSGATDTEDCGQQETAAQNETAAQKILLFLEEFFSGISWRSL